MSDDEPLKHRGTIVPHGEPLQTGSRILGSGVLITRSGVVYAQGDNSATYVAVSSVAPEAEQTSILAAEAMFAKLPDAELYVYANDQLPIGPRIQLASKPESTLKALANYEVEKRKVKVAEAKAEKDRRWDLYRILITAAASGLVGILIGWLSSS